MNLQDLRLVLLTLNDEIKSYLELNQVEKMDNIIENLGLDKERAVYYRKSRSLLSPENQQNGTRLKQFPVGDGIRGWKLPTNIASLKSLTIHEPSSPDKKTT